MTKRILVLGSKSIGLRVLEAIANLVPGTVCAAVTVDDRGDSRSKFESMATVAHGLGVPLHIAGDPKHAETLIGETKPDLCFVAGWYWILSPPLIRSVPNGFVGIHNSLLPKYRGGAPLVWALINGDAQVGASIFSLRDGMDDGPVYLQAKILVGPDEHVGEVLERLEQETLRILRDGFPSILEGQLVAREQEHLDATYCAQRLPGDGEIDWSRPAASVFNFIRAQSRPYPGAFTFLGRQELKVWRASRIPHRYDGTPGQVAALDSNAAVVVCGGASALRLEEVETELGPVSVSRAIRSIRTRFPRYPRGMTFRSAAPGDTK